MILTKIGFLRFSLEFLQFYATMTIMPLSIAKHQLNSNLKQLKILFNIELDNQVLV